MSIYRQDVETLDEGEQGRILTAAERQEDSENETNLRPQTLGEYIGQEKVKEHMAVYIEAARQRGEALDHVLLYGPPGLGKTHLSLAVAEGVVRSGWLIMYVSAPHLMDELERGKFQKDAAALEYREIIFGCDLLVIDDLGTEMVTSYTRSEVYDLVNTRLNTSRPTIINTNLGLRDIEKKYTSRVYSRIAGTYAVVEFKGRDIRLQKREKG